MKKDGLAQITIVIVSLLFFAGALIYAENREEKPKEEVYIEQLEEFLRSGQGPGSPEGLEAIKNLPLPPEIIEQLQQSGKK